MAGRPRLRIGQHGRVKRTEIASGVWIARAHYRGTDGITRRIQRRSPGPDKHGNLAETALLDYLAAENRNAAGLITTDSLIPALIDARLDRMEATSDYAARTIAAYRDDAALLTTRMAGVRVGELTAGLAAGILDGIRADHKSIRARRAKTILRAAIADAVLAGAISTNPVDELPRVKQTAATRRTTTKARRAYGVDQLPRLLKRVRTSHRCKKWDLVDLIILATATGVRTGELLALRWCDVDLDTGTVTIAGRLIRVPGQGLKWVDGAKTGDGRPLVLPEYAKAMLKERLQREGLGRLGMVFETPGAGTRRDPDNTRARLRAARPFIGMADDQSFYSFRKMVATAVDDAGLSPRVAADQLGHARPSMTQDVYMARGGAHQSVADALDAAAGMPFAGGRKAGT